MSSYLHKPRDVSFSAAAAAAAEDAAIEPALCYKADMVDLDAVAVALQDGIAAAASVVADSAAELLSMGLLFVM